MTYVFKTPVALRIIRRLVTLVERRPVFPRRRGAGGVCCLRVIRFLSVLFVVIADLYTAIAAAHISGHRLQAREQPPFVCG